MIRRSSLMSSSAHSLLLTAAFAGTLLASPASAQAQSASNKAAAEALFDEGVKLLKAGEIEKACRKLESSQRVDPGIGTLLYLGECYEQEGRTASAWATFREAASKAKAAGETNRARTGMKRAEKLESRLSRVTFQVASENEGISGLTVRQAKLTVNRALWGSAIPVDPGELVVVAEAPGYETFQTTISVSEGPSQAKVEIPALVALPEEMEEPAPLAAPAAAVSATPEDSAPPGATQRVTGLVFGGVGVAGLITGGVFGIMAINKNNQAKEVCDGSICEVDKNGVELTDQAQTYATVSTISFIAGGVLLATGGVLYFTAPTPSETAQIRVTPTWGGAELSLGGSF